MQIAKMILWVRGTAITVAIALMVLIPITALGEPRPSHFGWHMYAASVPAPEIAVLTSYGKKIFVPFSEVVAQYRPEVDYDDALARFVCSNTLNADVVFLSRKLPAYDKTFECTTF